MSTGELQKSRGAIHGGLFLASLILVTAGFPSIPWPWYFVIPVLVYSGIVLFFGPLRRTAPVLGVGSLGGTRLVCAVVLAVTSAGILVAFQALFRPDVKDLAAKVPVDWFGNLLLAGLCFSVVNAVLEEIVFRGVLWEVLAVEWNSAIALGVTSVLFGVGHLDGYPPGPSGAVMAGVYGVCLGVLRWWTGGLALATACHVCADTTIFCIFVVSGAFDGR